MKFLIRAAVILLGVIAFLLGKISIQLTKTSDQIATLKPLTYGEWHSTVNARMKQSLADGIKFGRSEGEDLLPVVMLQDSYVSLEEDTLDVKIVNPTLDVNIEDRTLDVNIVNPTLDVNIEKVRESIPVHVNR